MGAILLILQILGAIPQIIAAVKYIMEMIRKIRNPELRQDYRKQVRKAVFKRRRLKHMTMATNAELYNELKAIELCVEADIKKQGVA